MKNVMLLRRMGDIVDEDDDSVLDFSRTMTQREQREAREQ